MFKHNNEEIINLYMSVSKSPGTYIDLYCSLKNKIL